MALSYIDSTTSSAATITASNSIQRGDLLVLVQRGTGASVADVTPTGFTNIGSATLSTTDVISAKYKIATGQENGQSITGVNAASVNRKFLLVFRGSGPLTSVTPADYAGEVTDGDPATQTINASGQTTPLVAIAAYNTAALGTIDPRTFTVGGSEASDGELSIGAGTFSYCKYKIYNSSPADITVDMEDEGTKNGLQSFYISCTEGSFNAGLDFLASRQEETAGADADTPIPAVRANGDLLVCLEAACDSANLPTDSTPSTWTKINTASGAAAVARTSAFYKISNGTETAVGALSADTYTKRQVLVFRRFDGAISSVVAGGYTGQVVNTNPSAQTLAANSGTAPLVAISSAAATTAIDALTFTVGGVESADRTIGTIGTDGMVSKHKIYASSPASISTDMNDEGNANALQSFYLEPKIPVTTAKSFSASVTPSTTLTRAATRPRTFSASVTASATLAKSTTRPKSFSVSVTPSATFSRLATLLKSFSASVTPSATLSRLATRYKTFSASVTPSVTLSRAHVIPIGLASESDSALSTTKRRAYTSGLALETDTSFAVGSRHLYALGLSSETDSAFAVAIEMGAPLGQAQEIDSALSLSAAKSKTIGQAQETDSSFAVSVIRYRVVNVGQPFTTDTALGVTNIKIIGVGQATESDLAFPLQGLTYARRLFFVGRGPEEKRRVPNEFHIFKPNPN